MNDLMNGFDIDCIYTNKETGEFAAARVLARVEGSSLVLTIQAPQLLAHDELAEVLDTVQRDQLSRAHLRVDRDCRVVLEAQGR